MQSRIYGDEKVGPDVILGLDFIANNKMILKFNSKIIEISDKQLSQLKHEIPNQIFVVKSYLLKINYESSNILNNIPNKVEIFIKKYEKR